MPRAAAPAVLAVSLLLALALGGCGDGSLSAGDLRTQAAVICARAATATDRIAVPDTADGGERFLRQGVARLRPANARLRALKPPRELRAGYAQAVQLDGQSVVLIEREARAIAAGDDAIAGFRHLQTQLAPITRMEDATWRALQIPDCATH